MAQGFDFFCIGKTTIDQFLILNQQALNFHLDPKTGYLSFKHGEKIDVEELEFCLGGNATNVAVGLSRLGLSTALCSEIGDDEFDLKIRNQLALENIDRSHMIHTKNAPSSFSVIINFKGERTIFMQRMQREHNFRFDDLSTKYVFLTSLEKEWRRPYKQVLALLVKKGCKLVFNPGTLQLHEGKDIILEILEHTDILFVNKEEAEELIFGHEKRKRDNEIKYIRELLVKLQKMGAGTAVVTNGRYGSHAIDEYGNFYHEGLFPGEVVERTGAGDAYTTGFMAATAYEMSIKEAMKWGSVNSASVVGKVGATAGLLDRKEMEKRAKEGQTGLIREKPIFDR
jgi:ribokinase